MLTDSLLVWAFVLRVIGLALPASEHDKQEDYKLHSFQILSCVAPLIWMSECFVFFILFGFCGVWVFGGREGC